MHSKCRPVLALLLLLSLVACDQKLPEPEPEPVSAVPTPAVPVVTSEVVPVKEPAVVTPTSTVPTRLPISARDYTFGYWLNGMRKHADDTSPNVLCLESGYYGFSLDLADFGKARFGTFDQAFDYSEALEAGATRLEQLQPTELAIELESKGTVFRAVSCKAGLTKGKRHLQDARLWESGRVAQHYELVGLNFEDAQGRKLELDGSLSLVGWPESLSVTADIAPSHQYEAGWHHGVVGNGLCVIDKPWQVPHDAGLESPKLTVECWVKIPEKLQSPNRGYLLAKNAHDGVLGHYSFKIQQGRVSAHMNIARGAEGRRSISQRGQSFKEYEWNHLVLSYDGNSMCFYINGVLQGTEVINQQRSLGKGALMLGQRGDGQGAMTQAVFDQVRVWDRALTSQEVQAHAKEPGRIGVSRSLKYEENFDSYAGNEVVTPEWNDVTLRVRLKNADHVWETEKKVPGVWPVGQAKQLSLNCNLNTASAQDPAVSLNVSTTKDQAFAVRFDPALNCYVAEVRKVTRDWPTRGGEVRHYDEFDLVVENTGAAAVNVPFLLDLYSVAQITGVCPILCDAQGRPTGIPVQLSKNWHYPKLGQYVRPYMQLPAKPGRTTYKLRLVYGFYGTLPSASHAQLSLVGWGGNGRWDQLAIGCWGETICFDVDMSCVDVAITDVRMLMARNGADGKKWRWTDAGWGGDWLCVNNAKQQKLLFSEMKTAYLSHGPCLTEVRYDGNYGLQREVELQAKVQTLRTDDFARTFQTLKYTFDKELSAEQGWLFKMGRTRNSISPTIAYGNGAGLLLEQAVPSTLRAGELYLNRVELEGAAPWWVGFPGGYLSGGKNWGTGSRGWIIRSYRASFGGQVYTNPSISMPVKQVDQEGRVNLDLLLTPPAGVTQFLPGDTVEMEIEWITFPRVADDYYGPNERFRQHLTEHPESWQTIYREAAGNDLQVQVTGGVLQHRYPIIIQAEASEVRVQIEGGVGTVPIRFEGLKFAMGYVLYQIIDGTAVALDQSVHGNDFWQTDFDVKSNSFKMTFNLPLDGGGDTEWLLRKSTVE
ncbi:MAG: hypothetical protein ACI9JZ_002114 [Lentimonas sp.]|jgi:hypothetical protein